jgi:hypothetical protein
VGLDSWVKASANDFSFYRSNLLHCIQLPAFALLCSDLCCKDTSHHMDIYNYMDAISSACLSAAETSIPYTSNRHTSARRILGWSERIEAYVRNLSSGTIFGLTVGVQKLELLPIA